MPDNFGNHIGIFFFKLFIFTIFLVLIYIISKIISKIISNKIVEKTILDENQSYEKSAAGFIQNTFFTIIMIIGVYISFLMLGIDLELLFVPIGIGIGFGLEEVLKNILGGAIFLNMKDVKIGDTIQIKLNKKRQYFGKIIEVNTRNTVMQLAQGRKVLLPNSLFITTPIKTFNTEDLIRQEINFTVSPQTDFSFLQKLCIETVNEFKFLVEKDLTRLDFEKINEKGINVILTYYCKPKGTLVKRSNIKKKIKNVLLMNGIQFAIQRQILTLDKAIKEFDEIMG